MIMKLFKQLSVLLSLIITVQFSVHVSAETIKTEKVNDAMAVPASSILIQGATVHTLGALGTLENADILIVDGKISEVGTGLMVPEGATTIDAKGKQITPGLMNPDTALGLVEIGAVKSTVDYRNTDKSYSASLSIADVINPNSSLWSHNRNNGLTRAVVAVSNSKELFSGQGSLIRLTDEQDHLVLRDNVLYMTYGDKAAELTGGTRAVALMKLRAVFADLKAYTETEDKAKFKPKGHLKIRELKALLPVLGGEKPIVVNAHRANDIRQMLKLANDYDLKMIISGAQEAWLVKQEIAAANVALMLDPYSNLPSKFETIGNRIDQMTLLHNAGIPMMISAGGSHNAYTVRQVAGNAAAYGLPKDVALASISKTPAQWLGIGATYGTLESGMDADIVVWDGDPLEVTTSADRVFIAGKEILATSRQTKLRDRYLTKDDRRPAYRH